MTPAQEIIAISEVRAELRRVERALTAAAAKLAATNHPRIHTGKLSGRIGELANEVWAVRAELKEFAPPEGPSE